MFVPTFPALTTPLLNAVHAWSVESQQVARRNAMIAATQCAQRRAERQDVADFLAALAPHATTPSRARAARS